MVTKEHISCLLFPPPWKDISPKVWLLENISFSELNKISHSHTNWSSRGLGLICWLEL